MKCLVVIAHPVSDSLCRTMAHTAISTLRAAGHEVVVEDLYQLGFSPALEVVERQTYYSEQFNTAAIEPHIQQLMSAEALVLAFPTWWFGFPAILKGWFDRAWAPGSAYDHADDLGPIKPRLKKLRRALAITSLGSPWWVDRFVMRQPVKRTLKIALLGTCAPACRFEMLSLYKAERLTPQQVQAFNSRIEKTLLKWT